MTLTEEQKERLDFYAEIAGITRDMLLQAIIDSSLKDLEEMDRVGFLVSDVKINDQLGMFKKLTRQQ